MVEPLKHRGAAIEFGAEKEKIARSTGDELKHTRVRDGDFDPARLKELTPETLESAGGLEALARVAGSAEGLRDQIVKPEARDKALEELRWSDLSDVGKSAYAFVAGTRAAKPLVVRVEPNPDYARVSFEACGRMEVISSKFASIEEAMVFIEQHGWGHVHTSFLRGAAKEVQAQQVAWMRNANIYLFLSALERQSAFPKTSPGAINAGDNRWYFAINGLSVPTEEHLKLAHRIVKGENYETTSFSKHLAISMRALIYGESKRIGFEARCGNDEEKKRVIDSLLAGLVHGHWGASTDRYGEGHFRMIIVGSDAQQVRAVPSDFQLHIHQHLLEFPVEGLAPHDAERLYTFALSAKFYDAPPAARLPAFDQRACMPLLAYENLSWLTDEQREHVIQCRSKFISRLDALEKRSRIEKMSPYEIAGHLAALMVEWAHEAQLAEVFGRWLDGPERRRFFPTREGREGPEGRADLSDAL